MLNKFGFCFVALSAFATACSSSPTQAPSDSPTKTAPIQSSPAQPVSCSPEAGPITITAKNATFDKNCLASKAGENFTVALNNTDGFGHNFAILQKAGGNHLYTGAPSNGPITTTYDIPALAKGTYYFQCDFHPFVMNGAFTVG